LREAGESGLEGLAPEVIVLELRELLQRVYEGGPLLGRRVRVELPLDTVPQIDRDGPEVEAQLDYVTAYFIGHRCSPLF